MINTADSGRKGVPDMFVCIDGTSAWIELKWIKDDTSTRLDHHASATQIATLKDINKAGGLGFLLVGRSDGVVFWSMPSCHGEVRDVANMNQCISIEVFFNEQFGHC